MPICEDIWFGDVCAHLKAEGAELLVSPNGSPFERGKHEKRCAHARARVGETGLPLVYVNQFGGQDELVFDGSSFVMAGDGTIAVQGAVWSSDVIVTDQTGAPAKGLGSARRRRLPPCPVIWPRFIRRRC